MRQRARPAGAHEIRILDELPLGQIVGRRHRGDVEGFFGRADRRQRVAGRGQQAADEHVDVILQDQLLRLGDAGIGLALVVLDDELDIHAAELVVVFGEIELEAVHHILADLGEDAGDRRDVSDAQFFRLRARSDAHSGKHAPQQQRYPQRQFACHGRPPCLVAPTSGRRRCQCFRLPRFARCLVGSLAPLPDARRKAHQAHRQIEDRQHVDAAQHILPPRHQRRRDIRAARTRSPSRSRRRPACRRRRARPSAASRPRWSAPRSRG